MTLETPPENRALAGNKSSTMRDTEVSIHLKYSENLSKSKSPVTLSKNILLNIFKSLYSILYKSTGFPSKVLNSVIVEKMLSISSETA